MSTSSIVLPDQIGDPLVVNRATAGPSQVGPSAVSWGAILAGASAAAALSLILLILGTGLGLSSVSPWTQSGVSATTFGVTAILWLTFTQIFASGLGGYLAGRLRTKWVSVHTDEVYFRDTAHGFLSWAVASLATAALLVSVIGSILNGGVQAGAAVAGGAASTAVAAVAAGSSEVGSRAGGGSMAYYVDALFRKDLASGAPATPFSGATSTPSGMPSSTPSMTDAVSAAEMGRIMVNAAKTGALPADDMRYAGQIVAQRTGLSQADAEKRVTDTFTRAQNAVRDAEVAAKTAADTARKGSAYAALWLFISLLIGAFAASLAATYGGRQRDN